jgi:ABC-type multidrug transport system fused ATPase/permease subunit
VFRNTLGFVEQEFGIFEGTIRDNLTLLDRTIPDENVIQAAKDAEIHDVIQNMAKGYETVLMENGGNLSGGQRQRLELARAMVNNPSIVILDEATSALDAETEHLVMLNLRRRGCTTIIVAHRLSTIRDCDEIVVLSFGKVKERGTHDEMIVNNGPYSQLLRRSIEEEQA